MITDYHDNIMITDYQLNFTCKRATRKAFNGYYHFKNQGPISSFRIRDNVTQLIRGVAEKYFFAQFFYFLKFYISFPNLVSFLFYVEN